MVFPTTWCVPAPLPWSSSGSPRPSASQQFDFSSSASSPAYATVKKALPAALKEKFAEYQAVLLETHGKDLISTDSPAASGATTPAPAAAAAASSSSSSAAASGSASADGKKHINTSRVSVETNLRASASDVWGLLTDERKVGSTKPPYLVPLLF